MGLFNNKPGKVVKGICKSINHQGKEMPVVIDGKTLMICPLCDSKRELT